LTKNPLQTYV